MTDSGRIKVKYLMYYNNTFIGARILFDSKTYEIEPITHELITYEFEGIVYSIDAVRVNVSVNTRGEFYVEHSSEDYPVIPYREICEKLGYSYRAQTDLKLKVLYNRLNEKYFSNALTREIYLLWNDRRKVSGGVCHCKIDRRQHRCYDFWIEISLGYHQMFPHELESTLLHEMIHVKYPGHNHDSLFYYEMHKLQHMGASVSRHISNEYSEATSKYVYTCVNCSQIYYRHRKLKSNQVCGVCHGELVLLDSGT